MVYPNPSVYIYIYRFLTSYNFYWLQNNTTQFSNLYVKVYIIVTSEVVSSLVWAKTTNKTNSS